MNKAIFLIAFLIAGCATLPVPTVERVSTAERLARGAGLERTTLEGELFRLAAWRRFGDPGKPLRVYIEGDGLAWISRSHLSPDPTPSNPTALRLAAEDSSANVAYLARPCQYVSSGACSDYRYWSSRRFSEPVVDSIGQAIDRLKQESGSSSIELVGFSGGAAVAVLTAARRKDVSAIRTVAGNLDPKTLCEYHKADPLTGSLDPLETARTLSSVPQIHFTGSKDSVVPDFAAENFKRASGNSACVAVERVEDASHMDGWSERWKTLLRKTPSCA